ncbi:hypothetical protein ABB37_02389 [Leptomonas pyrrhocoris]|uniref:Uncharacterized protein n=1 Tax=Leptomonas pyrrhocoris TaxID=157538 RepID=A0A0N0DYR1_LEPPY|nr:hypothetical protein ABB37_02389 [Leptomonas pyrrhocoris]XP_015662851.1 hypothetical protein ABB37_02389 [Leptomonas pyrrhocoris]KPA84411.1 hypothetical protein ABB37_02389 [Leptomonas pyrrhocoris]KPA84412.1 hypothetical protein ABB37_02389 [Leptomonas pyrrhocoris]|eukprot:XP_015662850.1 hypothetical protein ABB37_02389 [Leptomonas pyrrhocoris]
MAAAAGPTVSPSSGPKRAVGPGTNNSGMMASPKSTPAAAGGMKRAPGVAQGPPAGTPSAASGAAGNAPPTMARKNSMNGDMGGGGYGSMGPGDPMGGAGGYGSMGPGGYGSMGPGGPMGGYGSMGGGGYGSMGMDGANGAGMGGSMYGQNPNPSSMYGQNNAGSMMGGPMGGSMYGQNPGGAGDAAAGIGGSMYGQNPGAGSMMGGMSSMYGMGGPFGSMGPGSMMGPMGGSMYGMGGPMGGSMYGMGGSGNMSTCGIAAQWGSLANMSTGGRDGPTNRSGISSDYGGFAEATTMDLNDLCPNIGTFDDAKDLKRSGKRGGNHLYSRDKHEKIIATNNSNAQALTIKRKADVKASPGARATSTSASPAAESNSRNAPRSSPGAAAGNTAGGKLRAKVPSNYNVHSLIIVDKAGRTAVTTVKDPSTVVFEKGGKKETFEADEAMARASAEEDVDSVLLSELRSNWFNGHNSSLMMCAGKGKNTATQELGRGFIQKCIERLEKNEKDTGVKFDVSMTMVALRGADQCCDLLKEGAGYDKMAMGSSPVYGPCLLDLETKVVKTGTEATKHFNAGLKNAKEEKEIVAAFYVLKTIKKTGAEVEVHLSSMCLALCGETVSHMTDIKDKLPSSPHRLFRYAVDGACVTVSGLCIDSNDEEAQAALEVERKMREVKNQPPRSGNVKRFVDFTYKEITRQKEKAASATGSEKKTRETQIERMEEMVKDANELLTEPEKTRPKGYPTGR